MPEEVIDTVDEKVEELELEKRSGKIESFFNKLAESKGLIGSLIRSAKGLKQKFKDRLTKPEEVDDLDG